MQSQNWSFCLEFAENDCREWFTSNYRCGVRFTIASSLIRVSHKLASKLYGIFVNWIINLDFKSNLLSTRKGGELIELNWIHFSPSEAFGKHSSTFIPYRAVKCIDLHLDEFSITSNPFTCQSPYQESWESGVLRVCRKKTDFLWFKVCFTTANTSLWQIAALVLTKHRRDWNQLQVFADKREIKPDWSRDQCLNGALLMPRSKTLLCAAFLCGFTVNWWRKQKRTQQKWRKQIRSHKA